MNIDRRWLLPSVAFIAFIVGLNVSNTAAAWVPKSGDAATWFGAVGAFLAFGATVWIATDQARQKDLEAHNLAVLASARIAPALTEFLSVAAHIERVFPLAATAKMLPNVDLLLLRLQSACNWTDAEIQPLVYLPNNVAYHLEQVRTTLPLQIDSFRNFLSLSSSPDEDGAPVINWDIIFAAVEIYLQQAVEINARVKIALNGCSKILPKWQLAADAE